ncbi:hypothetical protein OH76DRAFT_1173371 [Lentinus brumalis]|uniref:Uncharacterized protein n=1 Tax=Lentinus brumalis TaxID=2498619 RepID=A0A371CUF8_9APHY|nr:hypothetical protein OH76DRAFT_1173371 [Polyporus brumalis]
MACARSSPLTLTELQCLHENFDLAQIQVETGSACLSRQRARPPKLTSRIHNEQTHPTSDDKLSAFSADSSTIPTTPLLCPESGCASCLYLISAVPSARRASTPPDRVSRSSPPRSASRATRGLRLPSKTVRAGA